jgi:hypothetical protein
MGRRDGRSSVLVVTEAARPSFRLMTDNAENAKALASAMLDAGREPLWALTMVAAYFGEPGREAALAIIEERESERLN